MHACKMVLFVIYVYEWVKMFAISPWLIAVATSAVYGSAQALVLNSF